MFEKGRVKTGGRKKGTPNKAKADLHAMVEASGVEPFQVLLDLCRSRDEGIRLGAAKEASKYLYYQKRIQEISGPGGAPLQTEVEASEQTKELLADFRAMLHTKISERKG